MGNLEIKLIYWLGICFFLTKKKIDIFQLPFLVDILNIFLRETDFSEKAEIAFSFFFSFKLPILFIS